MTSLQTCARPFCAARPAASRPARRMTVAALRLSDAGAKIAEGAALAAACAGLLLGQPGLAEARVIPPTKFEESQAVEAELLAALKSRTGQDFAEQEVLEVPKGEVAPAAPAKVTLKLDKVAKEELVAPALPVSVPEPLPAPKLVEAAPAPAAPTPAPVMVAEKQAEAPKPVAAAAPAPVAATEEGASNNAVVLGVLAFVVVAGVAAFGSQQQQGEAAPAMAGGAPAPAAASLSPEEDAARRKTEVQAWIAAWRAKQQK